MVEQVRMFKTDDGKQFSDYDTALRHEADVKSANFITEQFPDNSKLASGNYYLLSMSLVEGGKTAFCMALRNRYGSDKKFIKALDLFEASSRNDLVGRLLCDSSSPFNKVFHMFASIDDRNRMFNQPYFTNHPEAAENQIPID